VFQLCFVAQCYTNVGEEELLQKLSSCLFQLQYAGHIQRFCPARRNQLNANAGTYRSRPPIQARAASSEFGKENVYIRVRFNGTPRRCLLDTGSEASLIPANMVKGCRVLSTIQKISAANGTDVRLLGYTTVPAKIANSELR